MLSARTPGISGQRSALSVGEEKQGGMGEGRPFLLHLPDRAGQIPGLIDPHGTSKVPAGVNHQPPTLCGGTAAQEGGSEQPEE